MKTIYFWIVLLVLIAGIISFYLIPSGEELALLHLKSQKYSQARKFYEEQYEKGIRTPSLVYEMSVLYEREGNLEKAIEVIREYANAHPEDLDVLKRLADLYLLNNQFDAYDQTLIKIHEQKGKLDPDSLRELSEYYKNQNNIKQQEAILKEIISSGKGEEGDYSELAYVYVEENEFDNAAAILKTRRTYFVDKNTIDMILFELWVDVKLGKVQAQEAVKTVADYLNKKNDPRLTLYVLGQFRENYPALAVQLIKLLQPAIAKNRRLENAVLMIEWEHVKQKEKVYRRLIKLEKFAKKDPVLQNFMFNVFLDRSDDKHLLSLIQNTPMQRIEERGIIDLSILANIHEKPIWAQEMQKALGLKYLEKHPLSALALVIGAQQKGTHEKFTQYLKTNSPTPGERYHLFRLAVAAHFDQEALDLGATLPPYVGLQDHDLIEIAQSYATMKKAEVLYPMIEQSLSSIGNKNAEAAVALLDIALHRTKKALEWMEEQKLIKEDILKAFYEVAKENKEYSLDLYIAQRLQKDYPSTSSESSYGFALVQVGKLEKGISILKQLYKDHPLNSQIQKDYFYALTLAAKKDRRYTEDLLAFMNDRERQGNVGKNLLRDFGYIYLEILRDFHKAQAIFFILANEESTSNRTDVQTLIYLWGPHVNEKQARWIVRHAELANEEDLAFWLENLNFIGNFNATICIFQKRVSCLTSLKDYFAYMQASGL